jgi:hypothetical protein
VSDDRIAIEYGAFWDVPRLFWITWPDGALLFSCPFSDELDDYPDVYSVYDLPKSALPTEQAGQPWSLPATAQPIATVPVRDAEFDPTRRATIGAEVLQTFTHRFGDVP